MSTWTVTLYWNDGTPQSIDLHDYDGDNLVLDDSFSKSETLHNGLKPVQDRANFQTLWNQTIASTLLTMDSEIEITAQIKKDSISWFYGHVRPVTGLIITNEADSVIQFELLDNSWKLKRTLSTAYEAQTISVSNAVIGLLEDAGYTSAWYTVPTISSVIGDIIEEADKNDYYKILTELLYSYGYVFYFDAAGKFQVYDFSVETSPTIAGTLNDNNMITDLRVERQIDDYDGVDVGFYDLRSASWGIMFERDVSKPASFTETYRHALSATVAEQVGNIGSGRIVSVTNFRFIVDPRPTYSGIEYWQTNWNAFYGGFYESVFINPGNYSGTASLQGPFSAGSPTLNKAMTVNISATSAATTLTFSIDNTNFTSLRFVFLTTRADVLYTVERDPFRTNTTAKKPLKIDGTYIYTEAAAERLANIIERRTRNSQYRFTTQSTTDFAVGAHVTLVNTYANISTTARITGKMLVDLDAEIYEYALEGVEELGSLFGSVTSGGTSPNFPDGVFQGAIEGAANGLTAEGTIIQAIKGNALSVNTELSETGLYFDSQFMGFYDLATSDWVARIQNDSGVGKAKFGTGTNYMEWDGTELNVKGAATIDGTITAGDGIESANFAAGSAGWQITGNGDAEFNDVTVRGTIEAATGEIGAWVIADPDLRDTDSRILLRPTTRRIEIRDALTAPAVVLGYLGGIGTYAATDYGLYVAPGNAVRIESGGEFAEGNYTIESDAAYLVHDGHEEERARFGSLGLGDIGIDIGGMIFGNVLGGGHATPSQMPSDGLVALWPFNEGSGSTAFDIAGDNDGTLVGSPQFVSGPGTGGALEFDGGERRVDIGGAYDTDFFFANVGNAWGLSIWFRSFGRHVTEIKSICGAGGGFGGAATMTVGIHSDGQLRIVIRGASNYVGVLDDDAWHHLVIDWNGSAAEYAIDGGAKTALTVGTAVVQAFGFAIGSHYTAGWSGGTNGSPFDGRIADPRIYNRALSAAEVAALYTLATPLNPTVDGGGDATTTGFVSGGGGAKYGGAYGGMLYSLAEGKLALSGDLVAAGGTFSGDLVAAGGTFSGELIAGAVVTGGVTIQAGGSMQSDNYVPDSAGWRITDTGIEIDDGTFRGDITGSTITGGTIDIGGGTFVVDGSGDVDIDGDLTIDENGQITTVAKSSSEYTTTNITSRVIPGVVSASRSWVGGGASFSSSASLEEGDIRIEQSSGAGGFHTSTAKIFLDADDGYKLKATVVDGRGLMPTNTVVLCDPNA